MPSASDTPTYEIPEVEKTIRFVGKWPQIKSEELDAKILKAIQECSDLTELRLEGYHTTAKSAKAIGEALESQSSLKKVIWKTMFNSTSKTEISPGLTSLIKGITTANVQLVVLDLSENRLDAEGLVGLKYFFASPSSCVLEELNLNDNDLGAAGAKLLSECMAMSIENSLTAGKSMHLKKFECANNILKNDGVASLAKCLDGISSLVSINLASNEIGPSGMTALSNVFYSNPLLEEITLDDNDLCETGANRLSSCLRSLQKLQVLNLEICHIGSNGALHLARALRHSCPELRRIDLSDNEIAYNVENLLDAMENKKYFEDIDLSGNNLGGETEQYVRQRIFNIRSKMELVVDDDDSDDE